MGGVGGLGERLRDVQLGNLDQSVKTLWSILMKLTSSLWISALGCVGFKGKHWLLLLGDRHQFVSFQANSSEIILSVHDLCKVDLPDPSEKQAAWLRTCPRHLTSMFLLTAGLRARVSACTWKPGCPWTNWVTLGQRCALLRLSFPMCHHACPLRRALGELDGNACVKCWACGCRQSVVAVPQ